MLSLQRLFLFPKHLIHAPRDAAAPWPELTRLWIDTEAGPVEGWLLPGDGVSAARPGPAVLFAHGNGELIDHWPALLAPYRAMGASLLLTEYRGYGRSAGQPSEEAITRDMVRFYDALAARPEVDPQRIIFHGRSLGGGAVCALAAQRPPAALILHSTFTSVRDLMRGYLIPGFFVLDPFDNLAVLQHLRVPTLIIHGQYDTLIPFSHAQALVRAAPHAKLIALPCDHNDCPPRWSDLWPDLRHHLDFLLPISEH